MVVVRPCRSSSGGQWVLSTIWEPIHSSASEVDLKGSGLRMVLGAGGCLTVHVSELMDITFTGQWVNMSPADSLMLTFLAEQSPVFLLSLP